MQVVIDYQSPDDTRLAELAAGQHGVTSRLQLGTIGFSKQAIQTRLGGGRLHRIHRGVYAVGHTDVSLKGRWMAAVLACGPGAVLSHRDAATLHELRRVSSGGIDVTATTRHDIAGINCHFVRSLHPEDATVADGIPVTSVSRTLLDLAESLSRRQFRATLEQAERERTLDVRQLEAVLARSRGRHGLKPCAEALSRLRGDDEPWTQSKLEQTFLQLTRSYDLPVPQMNVYVAGELVDCCWPEQRLIVEVDGWSFHRTKRSFEADRERDAKLVEAGWRVVRFTHDRVTHAPAAVAAQLSRLLAVPLPRPGR
jgi:very-short-patch-repair endonuclease